jgi:hypothetical protein
MDDSRSEAKRCAGTRRDGLPCGGPVLSAGAYCFAHDPTKRAERDAARQRGGQQSATLARLHRLAPPALLPVWDELLEALGEVHRGELAASKGLAMAAIARALVAVLQVGEMEERLRQVEGRASA